MSLWGKNDADANTAPKYKVEAGTTETGVTSFGNAVPSEGRIVGTYGVDTTETGLVDGVSHAGWVVVRRGTGPIASLVLNAGGSGYGNGAVGVISNGSVNSTFSVASTNSTGGITELSLDAPGYGWANVAQAVLTYPANGIYGVTVNDGGSDYANGELITFSNGAVDATGLLTTNATGGITAVTFTSGGQGFSNTTTTTIDITTDAGSGANITPTIASGSSANITFTLGGRAGRTHMETLVAMGSMTGDTDDALFPDS